MWKEKNNNKWWKLCNFKKIKWDFFCMESFNASYLNYSFDDELFLFLFFDIIMIFLSSHFSKKFKINIVLSFQKSIMNSLFF